MSKSVVLMIGFVVGLTLFFSSCGGDDMEDLPSIDIPLAFLSPMAVGDYTVKITITAADIANPIINEQNLAIVEGLNQTYEVTVNNVPIGNRREVKVEVFKTGNRLFVGSGTVNISSGANQLALRLEKVAELPISVSITPAAAKLTALGDTLQLSATVADREGHPIPDAPVSWSSNKPSVASINADGVVTARDNGKVTITAKSGPKSSTAEITVAQSPTIIEITPAIPPLIDVEQTLQLGATVRDPKNNLIAGVRINWASSNLSVAIVSSTGLVTARGNGRTTIIVSAGGLSGTVTITVPDTTGPSVVSGTVSDGDIKVGIGPINAVGFRFDFNEPIIGSIKLTNNAGTNLNWIANVLGQTATLTMVPGKKLAHGRTYKIEIDVKDGVGNPTKQTITFVTDKPK